MTQIGLISSAFLFITALTTVAVRKGYPGGQLMRPPFRLVPDFIIPNLENSTYGEHLHWEDKRKGSFKISRIHQSSELWNDQCLEVYKAWSMIKKHWQINDKKRITKAKHRLITALRRSPEIEMLKRESLFYRFRIIQQGASDNSQLFDKESTLNEIMEVPSTLNENKKEFENISNLEEIEKGNVENDPMSYKDQNNVPAFSCYEDGMNFVFKPLVPSENSMQRPSITDDIFGDDFCTDEAKSPEFSDRCCCEVLLDNFLCNQKCIWHGMTS